MKEKNTKKSWGGTWTEQKLGAFEKYVKAYLTIMNKYRDLRSWKLIYFDAFAGSGMQSKQSVKPIAEPSYFSELGIEPSESAVYKGAAERVVQIEKRGFNFYYFIDSDKKASEQLKTKLETNHGVDDPRLQFRVGDANEQIVKLGNLLQKDHSYKALALLDPFGMQVKWESLAHLQGTGTDLWILVPTGVAINRLLEKDGTLTHIQRLTDFFDMTAEEIRSHFYKEKKEKTLLGTETYQSKVEQSIKKIADLYVEKLKKIFKHVTDPLVLRNTRNVPIYHFVFASNNDTAKKIATQIIGGSKK